MLHFNIKHVVIGIKVEEYRKQELGKCNFHMIFFIGIFHEMTEN